MHRQQIKNVIFIPTELAVSGTHYIPIIDLNLPVNHIKRKIKSYFWQHFVTNFDPENTHKLHHLCPCGSCIYHSSSDYHHL